MKRFFWVFVSWTAVIPLIGGWLTLMLFLLGCFLGALDLEIVHGGFTVEWESSRGVWKLTV